MADSLRAEVHDQRRAGKRIGFVPTMGALHEGHLTLVDLAREKSDFVVVSIFVNPTQFGPNEDFARYPRTPEEDCRLLEARGCDLVYLPARKEMYGDSEEITIDPGPKAQVFEGEFRPTHFKGVLTVVAKLFMQLQPDVAVFGQKDAQQLFLIRRMTRELQIPIEILAGETAREADGLALSSRNRYLKQSERERAGVLFQALQAGKQAYAAGERDLTTVRGKMRGVLDHVPEFAPDYYTAVSEAMFAECDPLTDEARFIIAGRLGPVRLIDNLK